ncbi:carbonic anhydrase [Peribacillus cavernae]|uniref:carbonic anhydrase n=1 Tax=Peribacillus cavernae TaxID=1674310 RepID=A0A3S1BC48_9BACI|nr:carbonic anhydrase [Peribacillus cavernae]MDQ0217887.1 carbonic anhydrase [Peribacillus cavernae]RUQ32550.1 carbonic anhydrase [Peribacillus cavernae]
MALLTDILEFNDRFVQEEEFGKYQTDKYPEKKMVVLSCMDTRLVELLPKAMNLKNGDMKHVKTAGAILTDPFGSAMQSILVAIYELKADEVFVVGHHDCGMSSINPDAMLEKMTKRGISSETIKTLKNSGIDLNIWLQGFDDVSESVKNSVQTIKNHPLIPEDVPVHGLVISPETGKLDLVVNGYPKQETK